jgi:peptide/nickel transport system permease protein
MAIFGVSVPHYWLAIVLIIIFSIELDMLPSLGMGPAGSEGWAPNWANFKHMILPMIGVSVISMGIIARSMRTSVAEILNQEFVQTLRAEGLREGMVLRHVMKNAAPTVLAVVGLQMGNLMGGSILIETVFSWPGTGFLLNEAIFRRDLPVLQGTILVLALFFVALNLIVDVLQTVIDPRIKRD